MTPATNSPLTEPVSELVFPFLGQPNTEATRQALARAVKEGLGLTGEVEVTTEDLLGVLEVRFTAEDGVAHLFRLAPSDVLP